MISKARLPNGLDVMQVSPAETDFLYREICVDRCYLRPDAATVVEQAPALAGTEISSLYGVRK